MSKLQFQLRDACNDIGEEVSFRHNYSGRGMYGDQCVGITGSMSDCMQVIGQVIKDAAGTPNFELAVDTLLDFETDSMGRDVIVYWRRLPGIEQQLGIGVHYQDGCCPDCGDEIPLHKVSGSSCDNCGHVFCEQQANNS